MMASTFSSQPRIACFTDIHFGARANSEQHLTDCLKFVDWFIDTAAANKATHLAFLGDWFESRNAINVRTLIASQEAARKLNAVGLPVFFIVGNHDLYHRNDRNIFSTDPFSDLENFVIIDQPMELMPDLFAAPFLFKEEYPTLAGEINSHKYVIGHFEFRNFVVTGADRKLDHGPDAEQFKGPKYLMSGHFHKRQVSGNVVYIGNAFPTTFGDAGDSERGCAILDMQCEDIEFYDYAEAPLFFKTRLSAVLNGETDFTPHSRVRCLLDADIGYSEVQALREEMMSAYNLREFSVEEDTQSKKDAIIAGMEIDDDVDLSSLDNTVRQLIHEGVSGTATIDSNILVQMYEEIKLD